MLYFPNLPPILINVADRTKPRGIKPKKFIAISLAELLLNFDRDHAGERVSRFKICILDGISR